jgi:hypothetical protein
VDKTLLASHASDVRILFDNESVKTQTHFKDAVLDELADVGNVAQFVSFSPNLIQRYSRVIGFDANHKFRDAKVAVSSLLDRAADGRINIRSFDPNSPQGNEFLYGITRAEDALSHMQRLAAAGLFLIANETVDVFDGGVSGVAQGNVIEFAPGATPRIVENGNVASLDRELGCRMLSMVYGFSLNLPSNFAFRSEFSIHPVPRGFRREHTILWEVEEVEHSSLLPSFSWPNAFSEFIGDKVFGLLVAEGIGQLVPATTVLCRNIAPFKFGRQTASSVKWMRTSPKIAEPGFFPTVRGWTDPFKLMAQDQTTEKLASVLIQDEVPAEYSGALLTMADGLPMIEGVPGFGDDLMLGRVGPSQIPEDLAHNVARLHTSLYERLGSIRAEWAFDGTDVWVLQLQQERSESIGRTIVPGHAETEIDFYAEHGLAGLRDLVGQVDGTRCGIRIIGSVGMTSHMADLLRRYNVPSRIAPA